MMIETAQPGCARDVIPDFEAMNKFIEDDVKRTTREQEITKIREIHSQQDKRNPEPTKRFVGGRLSRRWSQHLNLDDAYRAPSLFTWRC